MEKNYRELYEKIANSDWFKKAYHDKSLGECPIVVEELEENEDEKIRKSLIKDFQNYYEMYDKSCGEPKWGSDYLLVKDILAWLERKKEQKSEIKYVYPIFKVGDTIKPKAYNESHRINEIKDDNYVLDNGFTFPIIGQDVWEIVEQKPAVYIPKFKVGDKVLSTKNPHLTYNIIEVGLINELGNPEYRVEILTDEQSDTPPNIKLIECQKMDSWGELVVQNPAEWSEEDDKMLKSIIEDSQNCHILGVDQIDWIKSLRPQPHWKPSEEQMEALECAERWYSDNMGCNTALYQLLCDLKKL